MKYQLIKNGIVENTILSDNISITNIGGYDHIIANNIAGPGWIYRNGNFTEPVLEDMVLPKLPISQLEFLRKFTAEERISIRESNNSIIMDFLHLLNLAQDIRLDDPDTIAGVNYLESMGLLAEGRATEILT